MLNKIIKMYPYRSQVLKEEAFDVQTFESINFVSEAVAKLSPYAIKVKLYLDIVRINERVRE